MKSIVKDFFRDLWNTRSRFLSITLIVALGCGFFAGVTATGRNMKLTLDTYLTERNFFDITVTSNFGITKDDIDSITKIDGVKTVRPAYQHDVLIETEEGNPAIRINSYDGSNLESDLNRFDLIEGRLPEKPGECLVEDIKTPIDSPLEKYFHVGEKIKLISGKEDQDIFEYIKHDEYTVVGLVASPLYFVATDIKGPTNIGSGTREGYMLLPDDEFTMKAYASASLLISGSSDFQSFSEEYDNLITSSIEEVEKTSNIREPIRFEEIKEEPLKKIEDAEQELEDGKLEGEKEISDGKIKIEDAEIELKDGRKKLADGQIEFDDEISKAEKKLQDAKIDLEKAEKDYEEGSDAYYEGAKKYEEAKKQAEDTFPAIEKALEDAKIQLDAAKVQLDAAKAQIEAGYREIETKQQEINAANNQIAGINSAISAISAVIGNTSSFTQSEVDGIKAGLDQIPFSGGSLSSVVQSFYDNYNNGNSTAVEEGILNGAMAGLNNEVSSNQELIDQGQIEIDKGKETLDASKIEIDKKEQEYQEGLEEYEKNKADFELGKKKLEQSKIDLDAAAQELKDARKKIDDGQKEYNDGQVELQNSKEKGQKELKDAEVDIAEGEIKLEDAKKELNEAEEDFITTIKDAEVKIEDGRKELANLSQAQWSIIGRQNYQSVFDFRQNAERIDAISRIFPAFFFAIAALVCLTTMTRMVEDKRSQIGTLKSLGYSQSAIMMSFLFYAILASVIGSVLGLLLGLKLFPYLIFKAYSAILYRLPTIISPFWPGLMIGTAGMAIACVVIATLGATLAFLKEEPASLLRPQSPKIGQRILLERATFIWSRLKFSHKVTMRNLFRYKKRMMMSLVGIAGCTALMLAGFGLRDTVSDTANAQFREVLYYDAVVIMDEGKLTEKDTAPIKEYLNQAKEIESYFFTGTLSGEVISSKRQKIDNVTVKGIKKEEYDELNKYFGINYNGKRVELPETGAIISEKLLKLHDKKIGDNIKIKIDKVEREVEIKGIMDNYVGHYAIMDLDYLEKTFNKRMKNSAVYLLYNDENMISEEAFSKEVMEQENVVTVSLTSSIGSILNNQMDSLNMIVLVLIAAAGLLSFVVMYNLTNINITERKREIATLKVLGFYENETSAYIFRENILLTIIGSVIGLVGGIFLTKFLVNSAEMDELVFAKQIKLPSYLFSFALSIVFSVIVRIVMGKRLKEIDMIESLKSVE